MRINTNLAALNAWRTMTTNSTNLQKSLERLASGSRVNRAADDAAGLAVSEKMNAQIRGLNMATRNTQDAISLIQTAEGGAAKIQEMMQRMRELAVQAGSDTLKNEDREKLQKEFEHLQQEIDRTTETVTFNTMKLINGESKQGAIAIAGAGVSKASGSEDADFADLAGKVLTVKVESGNVTVYDGDGTTNLVGQSDGFTLSGTTLTGAGTYSGITIKLSAGTYDGSTYSGIDATLTFGRDLKFQVGANADEVIRGGLGNLSTSALDISMEDINIKTQDKASDALEALDAALSLVSEQRANMGAIQNRLENTVSILGTQVENLTSANSRIRDLDMAQEMANFTKFQILSQASTAMLAQANMITQSVLTLLR